MQFCNEMGIGEGRGDSMDRKDLKKKREEGREGKPQAEGPTKGGKGGALWAVRTAAPGSLHPLEACGHLP